MRQPARLPRILRGRCGAGVEAGPRPARRPLSVRRGPPGPEGLPVRMLATLALAPAILLAASGPGFARQEGPERAVAREWIASDDARLAAWGAFHARTLAYDDLVADLLERLLATAAGLEASFRDEALAAGILDALVALEAELPPERAEAALERGRWATLLLVARAPDGHTALLRALVEDSEGEPPTARWQAPRLLLADRRDPWLAERLMAAVRPRLRVVVRGDERRSFRTRCGARSLSSGVGGSLFVPEGWPPTALHVSTSTPEAGSTHLVRVGRQTLHLRRLLVAPSARRGTRSGGTALDTAAFREDLLVAMSGASEHVAQALRSETRFARWVDSSTLVEALEEFDQERATLSRRFARLLGGRTTADPQALLDALTILRSVEDQRGDGAEPIVLPAAWRDGRGP